jgi:hypothetical protein
MRNGADDFETNIWRRQFDVIVEEHDALRVQLNQIKRQQALLAEKAARLKLQIALRDKSRLNTEETDWC